MTTRPIEFETTLDRLGVDGISALIRINKYFLETYGSFITDDQVDAICDEDRTDEAIAMLDDWAVRLDVSEVDVDLLIERLGSRNS